MLLAKFIREIQKIFEQIPTPGAIIYNALPAKLLRKSEKKIIKIIIEKIERGTLIDIGSGTGYLSIEIAKMAPKLEVYGTDLSINMVQIARQYAKDVENVHFEVANAAELPFDDDTVDFITSTGSLHHWKRPVQVFDECFRVLKNGKEAWIYDGCPDVSKEDVNKLLGEYGFLQYQILTRLQNFHGFTKKEYESKVKNILNQTKFKDNYQMEREDMWMKISLVKKKLNAR